MKLALCAILENIPLYTEETSQVCTVVLKALETLTRPAVAAADASPTGDAAAQGSAGDVADEAMAHRGMIEMEEMVLTATAPGIVATSRGSFPAVPESESEGRSVQKTLKLSEVVRLFVLTNKLEVV